MKFSKIKKVIFPVSWILSATILFYQLPGIAIENIQNPETNTISENAKILTSSKNVKTLDLQREFNVFPETLKTDLILRDIDVATVLRILTKEGKKNIIIDNSVQGIINADLKDVSLNEAMKTILTSQELEYRLENNTLFVASRPAMAKKGLNRKYIKAFKLNNSNAVDIAKILEASIFNKGYMVNEETSGTALQAIVDPNQQASSSQTPASTATSTGQSSLISSKTIRGKVETLDPGSNFNDASKLASQISIQNKLGSIQDIQVSNNDGGPIVIPDTRTNSVLIAGLQEDILIAEETIKYLDKPLPQVSIEVSLVELTKTDTNDLGIAIAGQSGLFSTGFNSVSTLLTPSPGLATSANQSGIMLNTVNDLATEVGAKLSALIKNDKAKLLANPTVIALDGSESLIKITDQIISRMIVTIDGQTGRVTSTPELADIGIVLNILPKISDSGFITMRIRPSITTYLDTVYLGGGTSDESYANLISTREVILQDTRVKSGETLAIAGLLKETDVESIGKIPFIGDLPMFGPLFRNKTLQHKKSELVILITPKIIDDIAFN